MNKKHLKQTLEALLSAPETLHETLSLLCELAPLRHTQLQAVSAELHTHPKTRGPHVLPALALEVLKLVSAPSPPPPLAPPLAPPSQSLSYIDQLDHLLTDMELMTPLTPNLSPPEQLRRALMIEGARERSVEAKKERDPWLLDTLALASKELGELILTRPERWCGEGAGAFLTTFALRVGEGRGVEGGGGSLDILRCARWRPLLKALRRGLEGRELNPQSCGVRDWISGRVDDDVLEDAVYVGERVRLIELREVEGVRFEMIYCPPGEFWMGSEDGVGRDNERPRHKVTLTRGFFLGQTLVTETLWSKLMNYLKKIEHRMPVRWVSWINAVKFCNALSLKEGFTPVYSIGEGDHPEVLLDLNANGYRLPTEAEWEYAAKAGTEYIYSGGDDLSALAWYPDNSSGRLQPIGMKQANSWGFYDMSGNIKEWCNDLWDEHAYQDRRGGVVDPLLYSPTASLRVNRGGSYGLNVDETRVSYRDCYGINTNWSILGIRVVRAAINSPQTAPPPAPQAAR